MKSESVEGTKKKKKKIKERLRKEVASKFYLRFFSESHSLLIPFENSMYIKFISLFIFFLRRRFSGGTAALNTCPRKLLEREREREFKMEISFLLSK